MRKSIAAFAVTAFAVAAITPALADQSDVNGKLNDAATIVHEMTASTNSTGVPSSVLKDAKCVAVIPNLIQGGFIIGGRHGDGIATCRTSSGKWSPPAPFSLTGASFGLQIGGQDISLIMMVMNNQGMQSLMSGHFKVGAGVSAAAGPVGRQASASGGWNAAILTYSKSKGVYAGAAIKGAELQKDGGATKSLYRRNPSFSDILDGRVAMPPDQAAHHFVDTVQHAVARAESGS